MEPRVAFLTPYGRSGSLLIQSLLDDHSEVSTFPAWVRWDLVPDELLDVTKELNNFIKRNPGVFDLSRSYYGTQSTEIHLPICSSENQFGPDRTRFKDAFSALVSIDNHQKDNDKFPALNKREFIIFLHQALYISLGKALHNLRLILIHVHFFSKDAIDLSRIFNDAFYLITIRDLREAWLSTRNLNALRCKLNPNYRPGVGNISEFVSVMRNRFQDMLRVINPKKFKGQIVFIDLNTLHANGEVLLKSLVSVLGLTWTPSLMSSTVYGYPWDGNIQGALDRSFSSSRSERKWKTELEVWESSLLEKELQAELLFFGYLISGQAKKFQFYGAEKHGMLLNLENL